MNPLLICNRCHETKWCDQFQYRNEPDFKGYRKVCKNCVRAQYRAYYLRNRAKKIACATTYQKLNPEKVNLKNRWWRARRREMSKNWITS